MFLIRRDKESLDRLEEEVVLVTQRAPTIKMEPENMGAVDNEESRLQSQQRATMQKQDLLPTYTKYNN